jgi:hypothetical protein
LPAFQRLDRLGRANFLRSYQRDAGVFGYPRHWRSSGALTAAGRPVWLRDDSHDRVGPVKKLSQGVGRHLGRPHENDRPIGAHNGYGIERKIRMEKRRRT